MKKIIISLLLFFTAYSQDGVTRFFINRDASGSNNGTSWTNAWTNFESINWGTITAGDTIYVSGGADSTVYRPTYNNSGATILIGNQATPYTFASGNPVVICPSWESAHSGDVYIMPHSFTPIETGAGTRTQSGYLVDNTQNFTSTVQAGDRIYNETENVTMVVETGGVISDSVLLLNSTRMHAGDVYNIYRGIPSRIFECYGISNLKIIGFNLVDTRPVFAGFSILVGGVSMTYDSLITLENWHYIGSGHNYGMYDAGYKTVVKNSIFENLTNDTDDPQDPFGISSGRGNITVEGCKIILRGNSTTTEEHADGIQFSNYGLHEGDAVDNIIRNNLIIQANDQAAWNAMVYSSNPETKSNFYIYNNVFVSNNNISTVGGLFIYQPNQDEANEWTLSIYAVNNTFLLNSPIGGGSQPFTISGRYVDTLVIKNNIVTYTGVPNTFINIPPFSYMQGDTLLVPQVYHREIDYNAYSEEGGITTDQNWYPGERFGSWTLAEWLADTLPGSPWDAHSLFENSDDVIFSTRSSTDIADYYTETGRDLGVDLSVSNPDLFAKFPDLEYDILGNPRSGTWDMGALEYQDGAVDTIPSFSFTALNNQEINTAYIGSATFSGADSTFTVYTTTGARFNINSSGSLSTTPKTAVNGDVVYVETVTGSSYSTGYSETIIAGGQSRSFTVTTKVEPVVPSGNGGVVRGSDGKIWKDSTGKVIKTQ